VIRRLWLRRDRFGKWDLGLKGDADGNDQVVLKWVKCRGLEFKAGGKEAKKGKSESWGIY
jgi:hypothetical protein